jgi:hypothetical protein
MKTYRMLLVIKTPGKPPVKHVSNVEAQNVGEAYRKCHNWVHANYSEDGTEHTVEPEAHYSPVQITPDEDEIE